MADKDQNRSGCNYWNDVFTDFESEMFCSITSKATNKTLQITGRTCSFRTRRNGVSKVPKQNLCRRIQTAKNAPQDKQKSYFCELYLHKIGTQHGASNQAPFKEITGFFELFYQSN